jgi:hypothetical protein
MADHSTGRRTATRIGIRLLPCLLAVQVLAGPPAAALTDRSAPPESVVANATWFYALGGPYGGCGLPQSALDTQYFVALNVYDLPNDYGTFHRRPIEPSLAEDMGMWDNGHNCGRWVEVTIGDICDGTNDGAMNQPFCRDGAGWAADGYNGAKLNMIVADSCGDGNAWCRDDPYHLDLAQGALNRFVKDGVEVGDMDPDHWNNRHISWRFIKAPDYTGDIRIAFLQSAQVWWPAISITWLENGIHGVEYYQDGAWVEAEMNGDMGQAYILGATQSGGSSFQIRVRDVDDELINDGRVYSFAYPETCEGSCDGPYTPVTYATSTEPGPETEIGAVAGTDPEDPGATETPAQDRTCTASYRTTQTWPGGFKGQITVTAGPEGLSRWAVTWGLEGDQLVQYAWNANLDTTGSVVTASSVAYDAVLTGGGSASFEFVADGTPRDLLPSCTAG